MTTPELITKASEYWRNFRKLPIGDAEMIMHLATFANQKDLVKENQYPKVMWVANRHDFTDAIKRVVFAHKCDRFIAWNGAETIEDAEKVVATMQWEYAKDIEEETEFQTKTRERIAAIERELEELKKLIK